MCPVGQRKETGAAEEVGEESIRGQGPGPGSASPLIFQLQLRLRHGGRAIRA